MKSFRVSFEGGILERGFWLYVWVVQRGRRRWAYVGRTGDSSSMYAGSPFLRLGQHLDTRKSATANMLHRNLVDAGIDPLRCSFSLIAVGPVFPEQGSLTSHRSIRDRVAPLETALASHVASLGFHVLGTHPKAGDIDRRLLKRISGLFDREIGAR